MKGKEQSIMNQERVGEVVKKIGALSPEIPAAGLADLAKDPSPQFLEVYGLFEQLFDLVADVKSQCAELKRQAQSSPKGSPEPNPPAPDTNSSDDPSSRECS